MRNFNKGLQLGLYCIIMALTVTLFGCKKSEVVAEKEFATALEIFKSLNPEQLRTIQNGSNEQAANAIVSNVARDVRSYLGRKYNVNIRNYFSDDSKIVQAGIVFAYLESQKGVGFRVGTNSASNSDVQVNKMTEFESCLYGTLTGMLGVREIKALVADFSAGAAAATVLESLTFILRRSFTAFTIAITVYEFGDCLNWW